jgi:hypothetical protein
MNNYSYPKRFIQKPKRPERWTQSNEDNDYPYNPDPMQIYDPDAFDALVNHSETFKEQRT